MWYPISLDGRTLLAGMYRWIVVAKGIEQAVPGLRDLSTILLPKPPLTPIVGHCHSIRKCGLITKENRM